MKNILENQTASSRTKVRAGREVISARRHPTLFLEVLLDVVRLLMLISVLMLLSGWGMHALG